MIDSIGQEINVGDLCAFARQNYYPNVCVCKILEINDKKSSSCIKIISSQYRKDRQGDGFTFIISKNSGHTSSNRLLKLNEDSLPDYITEAFNDIN